MKHLFLILALAFFSCQTETNKAQDSNTQTPEKPVPKVRTEKIIVKNAADYSENFINKLKGFEGVNWVDLNGDLLILEQRDTISFPALPALKEKMVFTGKKGNLAVAVKLERINQTSIRYKIEMTEFGKTSEYFKGIADISPYFFMGDESDEDDETGLSYGATAYSNEEGDCYTNIRIGQLKAGDDAPLLMKLIKNCNGKIREIDLADFPTLRQK
jgi:hypothetical protein